MLGKRKEKRAGRAGRGCARGGWGEGVSETDGPGEAGRLVAGAGAVASCQRAGSRGAMGNICRTLKNTFYKKQKTHIALGPVPVGIVIHVLTIAAFRHKSLMVVFNYGLRLQTLVGRRPSK